jgi:predicted SprT family Zn-dependent metalloprotease
MAIKVYREWHTDYSWVCSCGKKNIESEGQLDLDDGDSIFCNHCNKEYILNKKSLTLKECKEE